MEAYISLEQCTYNDQVSLDGTLSALEPDLWSVPTAAVYKSWEFISSEMMICVRPRERVHFVGQLISNQPGQKVYVPRRER